MGSMAGVYKNIHCMRIGIHIGGCVLQQETKIVEALNLRKKTGCVEPYKIDN